MLRSTPRARAGIVRKIRADMAGTVLQTWDRITEIRGGVVKFGGERPDSYEYPNGAHVYIGGMDDPGKVLSSERDWIYVNQAEQLLRADWETMTTRTTGRGAVTEHPMLFGDCNPGPPKHWIKERKSIRLLHSVHRDNPTLYTDAGEITLQGERTMKVLDALTGVRRLRLRDGLWLSAEGAVYEEFDPNVHVVKPFPIPPLSRRIRSIDFGFTNPFSCSWWYVDEDGRMFLYRQIYRTQRLVKDHAAEIVRLTGTERIEATVADHDAEGRAQLHGEGVPTIAAYKSVSPGIQNVQRRLQTADDGKPRLFIFENALVERDQALEAKGKPLCTEDEFGFYMWPRGVDGKAVKEEPIKEHDHGLDELRYACAYVDHLSDEPYADLMKHQPYLVHGETRSESWGSL
jgi:phage terminase large subunit